MKPADFKVGQVLTYVPNGHRYGQACKPEEHVVKKIGRLWVTAGPANSRSDWGNERFDPTTMTADGKGYASPGTYYLSLKEYEDKLALTRAWADLRGVMDRSYRAPKHLTAADIEDITRRIKGADREDPTVTK